MYQYEDNFLQRFQEVILHHYKFKKMISNKEFHQCNKRLTVLLLNILRVKLLEKLHYLQYHQLDELEGLQLPYKQIHK